MAKLFSLRKSCWSRNTVFNLEWSQKKKREKIKEKSPYAPLYSPGEKKDQSTGDLGMGHQKEAQVQQDL